MQKKIVNRIPFWRIRVTIASICVLMAIFCSFLWWWSYYRAIDVLTYQQNESVMSIDLATNRGHLSFYIDNYKHWKGWKGDIHYQRWDISDNEDRGIKPSEWEKVRFSALGFWIFTDDQAQRIHGIPVPDGYIGVLIPFWFIIAVLLLQPTLFVFRYRRRQQQMDEGPRCAKCGYDIRASKDRCPECGTPIVKQDEK